MSEDPQALPDIYARAEERQRQREREEATVNDSLTVPQPEPPQLVRFASGASRSADVPTTRRYDLISPIGLRRLADRYGRGVAAHGERNWEGGMPASVTANHLAEHLFRWLSGDRSDDHLAAVAWGAFALMHYEATHPECIDVPGGDFGTRQG